MPRTRGQEIEISLKDYLTKQCIELNIDEDKTTIKELHTSYVSESLKVSPLIGCWTTQRHWD